MKSCFLLLSVLFLSMFAMKLAGVIDWSWLAVTAPLWGALVMVVGFPIAYLIGLFIMVVTTDDKP